MRPPQNVTHEEYLKGNWQVGDWYICPNTGQSFQIIDNIRGQAIISTRMYNERLADISAIKFNNDLGFSISILSTIILWVFAVFSALILGKSGFYVFGTISFLFAALLSLFVINYKGIVTKNTMLYATISTSLFTAWAFIQDILNNNGIGGFATVCALVTVVVAACLVKAIHDYSMLGKDKTDRLTIIDKIDPGPRPIAPITPTAPPPPQTDTKAETI